MKFLNSLTPLAALVICVMILSLAAVVIFTNDARWAAIVGGITTVWAVLSRTRILPGEELDP